MKPREIIYLIALLALGVVFFIEKHNDQKNLEAVQENLKFQLRDKEQAFREFERIVKQKDDSLQTAYEMVKLANAERVKAHAQTQKIIKQYEKILYVRFDSDSARARKISELFPSYKHP